MRPLNNWKSLMMVAVALIGASCKPRPPINRVQPNALDKTFFVGPNLADPSDDPDRPTLHKRPDDSSSNP